MPVSYLFLPAEILKREGNDVEKMTRRLFYNQLVEIFSEGVMRRSCLIFCHALPKDPSKIFTRCTRCLRVFQNTPNAILRHLKKCPQERKRLQLHTICREMKPIHAFHVIAHFLVRRRETWRYSAPVTLRRDSDDTEPDERLSLRHMGTTKCFFDSSSIARDFPIPDDCTMAV